LYSSSLREIQPQEPKGGAKGRKAFGVWGGKMEVFFFLFAPSLPPRLYVKN
jgi:hypothetical protein